MYFSCSVGLLNVVQTGYQMVHRTSDREFVADRLEPGHTYRIRICCYSTGGQSDVCILFVSSVYFYDYACLITFYYVLSIDRGSLIWYAC